MKIPKPKALRRPLKKRKRETWTWAPGDVRKLMRAEIRRRGGNRLGLRSKILNEKLRRLLVRRVKLP